MAKITDGVSAALIARTGATYSTWDDLRQAAGQRQMTLAAIAPHSASGVAEALLISVLGTEFKDIRQHGLKSIFDAVVVGKAELGIIATNLIDGFNAASEIKVAPIVTFGAKRSPRYPDTPTLAEVSGNDKLDFTFALGFYGNIGMPPAAAERIYQALKEAQNDPEVVNAPIHADFPVIIHDAKTLRESFERILRVLHRHGIHIH